MFLKLRELRTPIARNVREELSSDSAIYHRDDCKCGNEEDLVLAKAQKRKEH